MKRILLMLPAVLTLLALSQCKTASNNATSGTTTVAYSELKNYFYVTGDRKLTGVETSVLTTQADFDQRFHPAAYMGKDGQPTTVDFSTQMVLGVALPETNTITEIKPVKLVSSGDRLTLYYKVVTGKRGMSWTMLPCMGVVTAKSDAKVSFVQVK